MIRFVVVAATAMALLSPAVSDAASRYAAPNGTGTECSIPNPCFIYEAVNNAASGDDIIAAPGAYGGPNSPIPGLTDGGKTIHIIGQTHASTGQQIPDRPLFYVSPLAQWSLPSPIFGGVAGLVLSGNGSSVSDVGIKGFSFGGNLASLLALVGPKTSADRVIVQQTAPVGTEGSACIIAMPAVAGGARAALRDSVCSTRSTNTQSHGLFVLASDGAVATLRNDTIWTSGGMGLQAVGRDGLSTVVSHNSIIHGSGNQFNSGWDVAAFNSPGTMQVKLDHSNYKTRSTTGPWIDGLTPLITDPSTPGNGNQTGDPVFEDADNSDFHPAAGSPTNDAGSAPASPLDLDGQSRSTGTGPDIGAYEFISPTNVGDPTISGYPYRGKTLTADPGVWLGHQPIAYTFQWQHCDASGSGCSNIAGATDSTYVVTTTDVAGSIRVKVTATNSDGGATATSAATVRISTYVETIGNDSPVAWWRLGDAGNTTTMTDATGHYPGTYANQAGGSANPGISGDGNTTGLFTGNGTYGYVNNLPAPHGNYSIETWVRQENSSTAASIYQQGGGGALWINSGGHPVFTQVNTDVVDNSTTIAPGHWYHVVGTWDGFQARIYVNGHETASGASSTAPSGTSTAYLAYGDKVPWLKGYLDEVALYDYALSADKVLTHFNADPPPLAPAGSRDPSDPADPVDPADPADPTDPDDPGTGPVKPGGSDKPAPRTNQPILSGVKAKVKHGKVIVTYKLTAGAKTNLSVKRGRSAPRVVSTSNAGAGTNHLTWNRKLGQRKIRKGKVTLTVTARKNGKKTSASVTAKL